jgi:hypothetical protein
MPTYRVLPCVLACACNVAAAAPQFQDLPSAIYTGKRVEVRLIDKPSRQYARILRTASHRPTNFAGRYVLASWGCGASCVMAAAVDAKTGAVAWLPFTVCCWAPDILEPMEYRLESRLLVVHGSINESGAASDVHYYGFDGRRFAPIAQP